MTLTAKQVQHDRPVITGTLVYPDVSRPCDDCTAMYMQWWAACVARSPGFRGGLRVSWDDVEELLVDMAESMGAEVCCVVLLGGRPSGVRLLATDRRTDGVEVVVWEFKPFDDDAPAVDGDDHRYLAFVRDLQMTLDRQEHPAGAWY